MRSVDAERLISASQLDGAVAEQAFATFVDQRRQGGDQSAIDLLPLLSVNHKIFCGRTATSASRMRAYAMAAFHDAGLPDQAVPYVVEVLETSFSPNLVGAAARALRGMPTPDSRLADYLIRSIYNIWQHDQPINFNAYDVKWPLESYTTALSEVFDTLAWMGSSADHVRPDLENLLCEFSDRFSPQVRAAIERCIETLRSSSANAPGVCCGSAPLIESGSLLASDNLEIATVEIEDQNGDTFAWRQFFDGKPSVVAFFYATCMNPRKCVQTIYNLADIHRGLSDAGLEGQVRLAAITYDPRRDTPAVLQQYGTSKGLRFDTDFRMLRVPMQFNLVIDAFNLGVNYIGDQVNDHRIELYLLNRDGEIVHRFLRLQADPENVIAELARLASK